MAIAICVSPPINLTQSCCARFHADNFTVFQHGDQHDSFSAIIWVGHKSMHY